jgi:hypothetical protein
MVPCIRCNTDNQAYRWPEFFRGSASKIRSQIRLSKIHWLLVGCSLSPLNQRLQGDETRSLVFSVAAATLGTAFFIAFLVGFAWLVRADIIFLK